jgi:hypothetical protein
MSFASIILSVGVENAFFILCCCKVAGRADRTAMEVINNDAGN